MTLKTSGISRPSSIIHANFFFVDIVGLSDPVTSTKTQIKKIETLNNTMTDCATFKFTPRDTKLVMPTGDGMLIGFLQGPELPLNLAIELHEKLAKYNKAKLPSETVRVRIGIHSGPAFVVNDILNNRNIWGPGIIIARRVMDIGDDGHILLSERAAEDLRELSDQYKQIIRPVHDFTIKHGQTLLIYSAYGKDFGNPRPPTKGSYQRSKLNSEIIKSRKTTLYPLIEVEMYIKDSKSMLTHYKRIYEIQNISDNPINEVLHGIATDTEKSFSELNIKIYDENNKPLKISSINVDKPYQKEFTSIFSRPIIKGKKGPRRYFVLEYEVEESEGYFENYFGINCRKFVITINNPRHMGSPKVYVVNLESDEIKLSKVQPVVMVNEDGNERIIARWVKQDIIQGQSFRFQWK
jgi:Adenylate and Guanylate cyclase catalytic domain